KYSLSSDFFEQKSQDFCHQTPFQYKTEIYRFKIKQFKKKVRILENFGHFLDDGTHFATGEAVKA
ncbi:MAG: hypothetical protein VZR14_10140, partial [Hallerella sp.]|nr:hypothetical protein [Hallerella sp.]